MMEDSSIVLGEKKASSKPVQNILPIPSNF